MQKTIPMRWHKAYVVILLIIGILRSMSLLGTVGEYVRYKFSSVYLTHYLDDILLWWLLVVIFDLITIVLIFKSYSKLKNFTPGAIGTHATMLVLLALGSGIQSAINEFLLGNSWQIGFLIGAAIFLPVVIPLWIYYHKRRRLYECSVAEREYLLYGTPMPEYKPRTLENSTFRTYKEAQAVQNKAPKTEQSALPPVAVPPAEKKPQTVQVRKKSPSAPPASPEIDREAKPPQIVFCRHCGHKLLPDSNYCTWCGKNVL